MSGAAALRPSRNRASTAMSASLTGDDAPLVQLFSGAPNIASASAPASRTHAASRAASAASSAGSVAGNGQALDAQGRRVGAVAEFQIVRRREALEYVEQAAGDGHLA